MLLFALACRPPAVELPSDSQDTAPRETALETGDSSDTQDSQEPQDTGPFDEDGDGWTRAEDCDDQDPDVNPAATETFDGEDDDCDGTVDANGDYQGSLQWTGRAWYQGTPHDFAMSCPASLSRSLVNAPWTVTCTTDPSDSWAQLLIGATLTLAPDDDYLWELDRWSGDVVVTSSEGWDTTGQGSLVWTSMEKATLTVTLDTNYLDFSATGKLTRH